MIVPAHNAARTIGIAVDSVLGQTIADLELIVIDDGSTDSTAEVVRSRHDERIRCVKTENRGVARARNRGIDLSSGEFVAFLDADDVWLPAKLERQLQAMEAKPSVGLCFSSAELVNAERQRLADASAASLSDYTEALLLRGNVVAGSASSALVRRSLLQSAGGFDPELSQCADWELWLRLSLETDFHAISEPLVHVTKAPGSMSSDPALLERDTFALLDKFFDSPRSTPYRRLRRRAYGTQWMVCAGTYLHAGRVRDSLRCVSRGLLTDLRSAPKPLLLPARAGSRAWKKRPQRG